MILLSVSEVQRRFKLLGIRNAFDSTERRTFETTSVVDMEGPMIGFATPHDMQGLNILNLRRIVGTEPKKQPSFFDHPWYLQEQFAQENCSPGWHFLHMNVLAESISRPFDYIRSLESRGLELPSAIEVTLMLFLHYAGTGEQLLLKKHTWCRDRASLDRIVTVGAFGRNGVFISAHPAAYASRGLGVCAKLRNPPSGSGLSG